MYYSSIYRKIKKIEAFLLDTCIKYTIQYIQYYIQLIHIDISINTRMIDRNLSNSNFIESSIIHIFDDDIAILYPGNDTNMTIVTIVSGS